MGLQIGLGSRFRKSPFHEALVRHGLTHVTVYNHMVMPGSFGDPDEEYRALVERVSLWDVLCRFFLCVCAWGGRVYVRTVCNHTRIV